MHSVSVTEFKAHCLELINQVAKTGQPMILTKRGKPTAMVSPAPVEGERKWVLGQFKDKGRIVGDILAPFDEPWESVPVAVKEGKRLRKLFPTLWKAYSQR